MAFDNPFINTLSSTGGQYGPLGFGDIGLASNQFRTLLGGSRQPVAQQYAPTLNQMLDTAAATRRNRAAAPGRTGGQAAENAQGQDKVNQQMATITGQAQSEAAKDLGNIGATEAQIAQQATDNAASLAQSDINSRRAAHAAMWSALIGGAASLGTGFLTAGASTAAKAIKPPPSPQDQQTQTAPSASKEAVTTNITQPFPRGTTGINPPPGLPTSTSMGDTPYQEALRQLMLQGQIGQLPILRTY
jgi:hypothetical protein